MLVLISSLSISCDKESNDDELQSQIDNETFATGDEDNDDDPDEEENKPKT